MPQLFSDMNLADAPDSVFAETKLGVWTGVLTGVETFKGNKDPDAEYLKFEFTPDDGDGKFDQICQLPDPTIPSTDPLNKTRRARIKQTLLGLGIDPEDMDDVDTDTLVGVPIIINVVKSIGKNGNTYYNMKSLSLNFGGSGDENAATTGASNGDPFQDLDQFRA